MLPVLRLSRTATVSPRCQEVAGQMAADKACAAGDEYVHRVVLSHGW